MPRPKANEFSKHIGTSLRHLEHERAEAGHELDGVAENDQQEDCAEQGGDRGAGARAGQ